VECIDVPGLVVSASVERGAHGEVGYAIPVQITEIADRCPELGVGATGLDVAPFGAEDAAILCAEHRPAADDSTAVSVAQGHEEVRQPVAVLIADWP
jgi:hypothetical protein